MTTHSAAGVLSLPTPGAKGDNLELHDLTRNHEQKSWQLAMERQSSVIDDLLFEIYDRWHDGHHDSFESDTFTENSSISDTFHWRRSSIQLVDNHSGRLNRGNLESQSMYEVTFIIFDL